MAPLHLSARKKGICGVDAVAEVCVWCTCVCASVSRRREACISGLPQHPWRPLPNPQGSHRPVTA